MKFIGACALAGLLTVAQAANPRAIVSTSTSSTSSTVTVTAMFSEAVTLRYGQLSATVLAPAAANGVRGSFPLALSMTGTGAAQNRQWSATFNVNALTSPARGGYDFSVQATTACPVYSTATPTDCMITNSNTAVVNVMPANSLLSAALVSSDPTTGDCRVGGTGCTPSTLNTGVLLPTGVRQYTFTQGPENVIVAVSFNDPMYTPSANPASFITATVGASPATAVATTVSNFVFLAGSVVFNAKGKNMQTLSVSAKQGLVKDYVGNLSPASNAVQVGMTFAQDCTRGPDTVTAYGSCSCAAGATTGTQTRTRTPGAQIGPINGGAICAARSVATETKPCACASTAVCAGRCAEDATGAQFTAAVCSCGPGCLSALGGCCADVANTCPANLPNCYTSGDTAGYNLLSATAKKAGVQFCGTTLRNKQTAADICTCDSKFGPGTLPATTAGYIRPCANFDGAGGAGCTKSFCSILTKDTVPAAGASAAWCPAGGADPAGGVLQNGGCSCAPGCAAAGNCCDDYTTFCPAPKLANGNTDLSGFKCAGTCDVIRGDVAGYFATGEISKICLCIAPSVLAASGIQGLNLCSDNAC